jgi:hypothetical protein
MQFALNSFDKQRQIVFPYRLIGLTKLKMHSTIVKLMYAPVNGWLAIIGCSRPLGIVGIRS